MSRRFTLDITSLTGSLCPRAWLSSFSERPGRGWTADLTAKICEGSDLGKNKDHDRCYRRGFLNVQKVSLFFHQYGYKRVSSSNLLYINIWNFLHFHFSFQTLMEDFISSTFSFFFLSFLLFPVFFFPPLFKYGFEEVIYKMSNYPGKPQPSDDFVGGNATIAEQTPCGRASFFEMEGKVSGWKIWNANVNFVQNNDLWPDWSRGAMESRCIVTPPEWEWDTAPFSIKFRRAVQQRQ